MNPIGLVVITLVQHKELVKFCNILRALEHNLSIADKITKLFWPCEKQLISDHQ